MIYKGPELELGEDRVTDRLGTITLADIPDPQPDCPVRLVGTTPILERLWRVALWDAESNIRHTGKGTLFAAGAKFRATVLTRDIAYSGVLGLNRFYPDIMRSSIEMSRQVQREIGFRNSRGHTVAGIPGPWVELDLSAPDFRDQFGTHGFTRRTDDVVWLWAAHDLFSRTKTSRADWDWLHTTGVEFFQRFYRLFWDPADGLYRGQASFIDVSWPERPTPVGGYPATFTIDDCVLLKAASTNALYVKGLRVMAEAAERLGRLTEAQVWREQEDALKAAIRTHLVAPDGRIAYYKDRHGRLSDRTEVLGTAFAVLLGSLDEATAATAARRYRRTPVGIPVIDPPHPNDSAYHNNGSWPFTDTFFLSALEQASGESHAAYNLALLARTVRADGFHEVVDMHSGEVKGSGHQLWSAAAFLGTCLRAGIQTTGN